MEVWGLILGTLALIAGLLFGIYHIAQSERNKDKLSDALVEAKTQLGDSVASDLRMLGDSVASDLRVLGEVTLKAIEKDGAESRSAILAVHKSIKEELG